MVYFSGFTRIPAHRRDARRRYGRIWRVLRNYEQAVRSSWGNRAGTGYRTVKTLVCILVLALAALPAAADMANPGDGITLSAGFSFLYGGLDEYAYSGGSRTSRLAWDLHPLVLAGTRLSGEYAGVRLAGWLWYALNESSGRVRDYDWDPATGILTDYSKHRIHQLGSVFSGISASFLLRITEGISITPGLGFRYDSIRLAAEGGFVESPAGSDPVRVYGTSVIYRQAYYIPYAIAGAEYRSAVYAASLGIAYSPVAMCEARDSHLKRDRDFFDTIRNARFYMLACSLSRSFSDRMAATLFAEGICIARTRGESYYVDLSTGYRSPTRADAAGIRTRYAVLGLSADVRL